MSCCRRSLGLAPKTLAQIQKKLKEIYVIFPGTQFAVVLTPAGEILAIDEDASKQKVRDVLMPVVSLKKAAMQFASTLQQLQAPVIHIGGRNHLFSLYDVDDNLLTFCSEMDGHALETFNTADADTKMQNIIQDLRLLIQNLML